MERLQGSLRPSCLVTSVLSFLQPPGDLPACPYVTKVAGNRLTLACKLLAGKWRGNRSVYTIMEYRRITTAVGSGQLMKQFWLCETSQDHLPSDQVRFSCLCFYKGGGGGHYVIFFTTKHFHLHSKKLTLFLPWVWIWLHRVKWHITYAKSEFYIL